MSKTQELKFTFGDKVLKFDVDLFKEDMDLDKLLKIDYSNLMAEMITFPVVVNRFGLLAAEMEGLVQEKKLDLTIYEAKAKNRIRRDFDADEDKKKYTIAEVDDALVLDKIWKKKKENFNRVQMERDQINNIYDSAKDKSFKLNRLSNDLKSEDHDEKTIQNQLNKVYFKIKEGKIK